MSHASAGAVRHDIEQPGIWRTKQEGGYVTNGVTDVKAQVGRFGHVAPLTTVARALSPPQPFQRSADVWLQLQYFPQWVALHFPHSSRQVGNRKPADVEFLVDLTPA
jgi:hypothetical protein